MTHLITQILNLMLSKKKKFFRKIRLKKLNRYLLDLARKPTYVTIVRLTIKEIKLNPNFKLINDNIYIAEQSNLFRGVYFDKGDRVRVEEISREVCKKAALQLSENLNSASFTVAFYHLDSTIISIFPPNEIKNIVSTFN